MNLKNTIKELRTFLILWSTQSLSQLGSAITNFALTLWLYQRTGSALQTALLSVCSYAPYVLLSVFAGAFSDRWDKKRVMLFSDLSAAFCTVIVLLLLKTDSLRPVHMYLLNAVNGLMNTVQQPAGDVAMTLITPVKHYQKTSGMRSLSNSLVTILNPVFATALFAFAGLEAVIYTDLATFAVAFVTLLLFIRIPAVSAEEECSARTEKAIKEEGSAGKEKLTEGEAPAKAKNTADVETWTENLAEAENPSKAAEKEGIFDSIKTGLSYLKNHPLILVLILFLAAVNFVASAFDAVLPALILPRENGGEAVLGIAMSCAGMATLAGSLAVTLLPAPKNRVRVIYVTMLISLSTENFLLAFTGEPVLWCAAQVIGWLPVPVMSANLDVILRTTIPVNMQGRVYACRNTLQYFTIPIGFFFGGLLVDEVCEPLMAASAPGGLLRLCFGSGKGSGAAMMMCILGILGTGICLGFGRILSRYSYKVSEKRE